MKRLKAFKEKRTAPCQMSTSLINEAKTVIESAVCTKISFLIERLHRNNADLDKFNAELEEAIYLFYFIYAIRTTPLQAGNSGREIHNIKRIRAPWLVNIQYGTYHKHNGQRITVTIGMERAHLKNHKKQRNISNVTSIQQGIKCIIRYCINHWRW